MTKRSQRNVRADICQFDVATWFDAVRFWEERVEPRNRYCLEVGGGAGGVSLWLALKGGTVVCSDLSGTKQRASALHMKYGVSEYIVYRDIDALAIPFENEFDIVVFKSVLGALRTKDRQAVAVKGMYKALKPGGSLIFAENLKGTAIHRYLRSKFRRWGSRWRYVSLDEIGEFLGGFTSVELRTTGVLSVFGLNETVRTGLSIVDRIVLNHLCPARWKYLVYGIATK